LKTENERKSEMYRKKENINKHFDAIGRNRKWYGSK
jgi:hypothetical protein